jgi:hypothetical protein
VGFFYNESRLNLQNVTGISYIPGNGVIEISDCNYINQYIYSEGPITITNCNLNNVSFSVTGSITVNNSSLINNSYVYCTGLFSSNNSSYSKSRVYSNSSIIITDDLFVDEFLYSNGDLSITNTDLSFSSDGGFHSQGTTTLVNDTYASTGRTNIYSVGDITLNNTTITSGGDSFWGASIYSEGTIITNNKSQITYSGSGSIFSEDYISFINSRVDTSIGGYVHSLGGININQSTIHLKGFGYIRSVDGGNIENSTFEETTLQGPSTFFISGDTLFTKSFYLGEGDGNIEIDNSGTFSSDNSTFLACDSIINKGLFTSTNNTFSYCGVINQFTLSLYNSLFATDSNCIGNVLNSKNNLFESSGSNACNIVNGKNNNITAAMGNLDPKYKYNGPFEILTSSSAAIDRGDSAICAAAPINNTSQNGLTRPQGSRCDIGSYEAPPPPVIDNKVTASSCTNDSCIHTGDATNNKAGKPINTRTGAYQYNTQDISIPTAVGLLTFSRDYSSMGISIASTLSPGWTHNQDTRLIMPTDPDGEEGIILFKLHTSNLYTFTDNGNGTFTPAPGLLVGLVRQDSPSIQYTITDNDQNAYIFDETGKLTNFKNAQGYALDYNSRLT